MNSKNCEVCEQSNSKYRCPSCRILYCSLGCYKTHKDKCDELKQHKEKLTIENKKPHNSKDTDTESGELTDSESEDEDKVSQEKLALLENSKTIQNMLKEKHLQRLIKVIDENHNPEAELASAMTLPVFAKFATECLRVVEGKADKDIN